MCVNDEKLFLILASDLIPYLIIIKFRFLSSNPRMSID